jgi:hypothetical protein
VKRSCSKLVLVFLMVAMLVCATASVQADTTDKSGTQGMTSSAIPLPPTAPIMPFDFDFYFFLTLMMLLL